MTERKLTDEERARLYREESQRLDAYRAETERQRIQAEDARGIEEAARETLKLKVREQAIATERGQGIMLLVFALCLIPLVVA